MADLLEFPASEVAPDGLPRSGDRYQAYGCWEDFDPTTIAFILPDWSITSLSYSRLRGQRFRPLGDPWDCDGECEIVMTFGNSRKVTDVVIIGRNLYRLVWDLGERRVNWLREIPKSRPDVAAGSPVVRSIEFRERSGGPFPRRRRPI